MAQRIAVVILNWNTRAFLQKFLPGVIRYSKEEADIVVIDNDSTDDSVEYLNQHFPEVHVVLNSHNSGFTGGYNVGLKQVEAEFYVLLNSDVEVTEGWLIPLLSLMEDESIAACQPKILSFHKRDQFEYAGAGGGFIDKLGYPFCRGRIFNTLETDLQQYDDNIPVFWATGACMFIRSSVFRQLGGFDQEFFAHMEEIDLCWRIQKAGMKVYYCGSSTVYHVGGGTLHRSNPRKTFLNFRNNLLMIYKNIDAFNLPRLLRMRFFLDAVASFKFLLSGSFDDFLAVWKAWSSFRSLKARYPRPVQNPDNSKFGTGFLVYPKSILWDYYLCGVRKFSSLGWFERKK